MIFAIVAAHRLAFLRLVIGEIGQRHAALLLGRVLDRIHDRLGDVAFVEAVRALLGDLAQGRGIFRILVDLAFLQAACRRDDRNAP